MEQVLHRGFTATVAAAVAGAGLIAVAPVAPRPTLHLQHTDVQLTYGAFDAVGQNIQDAVDGIFGGSGAWADFFNLDLDGWLYDIHGSLTNLVLIPHNLVIGGLAALLGQTVTVDDFLLHPDHGLLTGDPFSTLWQEFTAVFQAMGVIVNDLFNLDLFGALQQSLAVFDVAIFEIPAALTAGMTEFIWSDLLGMP